MKIDVYDDDGGWFTIQEGQFDGESSQARCRPLTDGNSDFSSLIVSNKSEGSSLAGMGWMGREDRKSKVHSRRGCWGLALMGMNSLNYYPVGLGSSDPRPEGRWEKGEGRWDIGYCLALGRRRSRGRVVE
jgi:hypothetical protein